MFPSQSQIGHDMARERQESAARIKQAESAASHRKSTEPGSSRQGWAPGTMLGRMLRNSLAGLKARFG